MRLEGFRQIDKKIQYCDITAECRNSGPLVPKQQGKHVSKVMFPQQQILNSWKLTHFRGNKEISVEH
jgi:hypothetical protein